MPSVILRMAVVFCCASTLLATNTPPSPRDAQQLLSHAESNALTTLLVKISDWIVTDTAPSKPPAQVNRSIFEYGNLARVLLSASKITKNEAYLKTGLDWCDGFVEAQMTIVTADGDTGGYWDTGYREVFIADTGTAVAALTLCTSMQSDTSKVALYKEALLRYAIFVNGGCKQPPTKPDVGPGCPPDDGKGFVIASGPDKGALGDGWYRKMLNTGAYTISTATTGSCAFVEMAAAGITSPKFNLDDVAHGAIKWLLDSRTADGRIPYIIHPNDNSSVVFQPITYSTESMIIASLRYPDMSAELKTLNSTTMWLAKNQNADGSWGNWTNSENAQFGFSPSGDAQRSPRAVSLIQWYIATYGGDAEGLLKGAITKSIDFFLNEEKMKEFGLNVNVLVTGFVGLAVADLVQPWVSFSNV
eukprot:m.98954 g.98954  ORF g.98954 m.98954 type:complete len:417 (+) comp27116_c0_seq1:160-1410(+)